MMMNWSPTLKDAIRDILEQTERENGILDAYAAATRIQKQLPEENVALEDIISALLLGRHDPGDRVQSPGRRSAGSGATVTKRRG
jgi:hypothetical protein